MPESSLWLINHEGNTFTLSTQHHKFLQLKRNREESVTLKRLSSSSWCAWALGYDHRVYIYVKSSDVPIRVADTLYENQRWMPFHKFSQKGLLPSDRYAWSDESGVKDTPKESFRLPSGHWEWEGDWKVDENLRGEVVGIEGWQYAIDFPSTNYTPEKHWQSCVRKRKWIRFRRFMSTDKWVRISDMEVVEKSECFIDISVGGFYLPSQPPGFLSVWSVTNNGHVFVRTNVCLDKPEGDSWKEISLGSNLGIINVCVGASNLVWAITWDGQALVRTGISRSSIYGKQWEVVECPQDSTRFMHIAVGKNVVWALSREGKIWFRKGTCGDDIQGNVSSVLGSSWVEMVGEMSHISVSANDQVFAIDACGKVYFRTGVTSSDLTGKTWQPVSLHEDMSIFQQDVETSCTCVGDNLYSISLCDYHRNKQRNASFTTSCSSTSTHNFNEDNCSDVFVPSHSSSPLDTGGKESDNDTVSQSPGDEEKLATTPQALADQFEEEQNYSEKGTVSVEEGREKDTVSLEKDREKDTVSLEKDREKDTVSLEKDREKDTVSLDQKNKENDKDLKDFVAYLISDNEKNQKNQNKSSTDQKTNNIIGASEELTEVDTSFQEKDVLQAKTIDAISASPVIAMQTSSSNTCDSQNETLHSKPVCNDKNVNCGFNDADSEEQNKPDKEDKSIGGDDWTIETSQSKSTKHKSKVRYVEILDSPPVEDSKKPMVYKMHKKKKKAEKEPNGNTAKAENNPPAISSTLPINLLQSHADEPKLTEDLQKLIVSQEASESEINTNEKETNPDFSSDASDTNDSSRRPDLNLNIDSLTESQQLGCDQENFISNGWRRCSAESLSPVSDKIIDFVSFYGGEEESSDEVDAVVLNANEQNFEKAEADKVQLVSSVVTEDHVHPMCSPSEKSHFSTHFSERSLSSISDRKFTSESSEPHEQIPSSFDSTMPEKTQLMLIQPAQRVIRYRQSPSPFTPSVPSFSSLNPLALTQTRYAWKWLDVSALHIDETESVSWLSHKDKDSKEKKNPFEISRDLRQDIMNKLKDRNKREIHQFKSFEQAVEKSTWVKKAIMQIYIDRGGGQWLPCNVELEQSTVLHGSKCLSLVYSPKRNSKLKQISLKDATCVKSSSNPDLQSAFNVYTSDSIQKPYILQAPSEAEAAEWISMLCAASVDQLNLNRPIPVGSVWSCTRMGDVLVSPAQSANMKPEEFFWGQHGGHMALVETGTCGITWGIGFDRMPYVYNGGYGGAVCTDRPSMRYNLQDMTDVNYVYVYENHMWYPVMGWCSRGVLNNNLNWITQTGQSVASQDGVKLPSSKWQWVSEWKIDLNTPGGVNSEGWQFSTQLFGDFHSTQHIRDVIRRRRWVRTCRLNTQGPWTSAGSLSLMDISIQVDPVSSSKESIVLWAVGSNGNVLCRYGVSKENPMGQSWVHIPTHLDTPFLSVSVGGGWRVWGIASDGSAWFRSGVTQYNPTGKLWLQVVECPTGNGILKQVSVGATAVWAVDSEDNLWHRKNVVKNFPEGTKWGLVASKVKKVSVGPDDELWIIAHSKFNNSNEASGVIHRRRGISAERPEGTKWERMIGDGWSHVSVRGRRDEDPQHES